MPIHVSPFAASPRAASSGAARVGASRRLAPFALAVLAVMVAAAAVAALCIGAFRIAPAELWAALTGDAAARQARAVLLDIRAPRVALALLVGGGFGTAGAAMQALFRNPLVDPGLVGVSSGAALGATTTIVLSPVLFAAPAGAAALPLAAFASALAVAALVYRLATSRGRLALPLLLLAGIAINALASAGIGLLTFSANDAQLRTLTFWSLGSLGGAQWPVLAVVAPCVAIGCALLARERDALNALQLGETEALHLGVPVQQLKRRVLVAVALAVGALVSCAGIIGFIGLVAPHCIRLACGPDQRIVMPGAALLGALLTLAADLAARTVAAPAEIPLGVLTALLGAPFFLVLLWKNRGALGG
ncbi:FecCD family ABC transporter permease [Burkholderia ubonensis]|uniref:Heme ABC transporter permease n=1 Tax=Burkholderia ubonensis TaxID=101571 RepID=A0AAW3MSH1_9BURK|nr:iron ABC transporter permease [Burkholderia ubonensis]KVL13190.1 heme ABC transporter permease [Burkholderia ubonensis]KVN72560.1 heme ABC transporter permease [Burkholderia ubonensis]KVP94111.1 heme ABC transporter permease [Burkholderia ubonensis]KVQ49495.1 heme ABC transporter permease [Burkholderia ubonensis]KVX25331.1 heme ABC transporter permease [Burkholderia ubonensis]